MNRDKVVDGLVGSLAMYKAAEERNILASEARQLIANRDEEFTKEAKYWLKEFQDVFSQL